METTPYTAVPVAPADPGLPGIDPMGVVPVTPQGDPAIVTFGGDVPQVPGVLNEPTPRHTYSPEIYAPESYGSSPSPTHGAGVIAEPIAHEPAAYEPAAYEPVVYEPTVSEPAAYEPAVSEPAAYQPAVYEPAVSDPASYEPAVYEPAPSTPQTYSPEPEVVVEASVATEPTVAPAGGGSPAPLVATPEERVGPDASPSPLPEALKRQPVTVSVGHEPTPGRQTTEQQIRDDDFSLLDALGKMLDRGASDLHLTSQARPTIRVSGSLVPLDDFEILTPPVLQRVIYAILTQAQRLKFEEQLELDFAYSMPGRARFRVNVYRQRDSIGAAFRIIPFEIKSLESLGIPPSVANFANLPRGFVLVTGPTGSGKSTTLAAVVDLANRTRHDHIMTVEDPIEFLHRHKNCLVNQREVGEDTWSFSNALKHVLRQDPDIILVGEMRDLETISVALTAAETGHLVFATLHTQDAAQTIDRIIDVFPPHQQTQVRAQLAMCLQGVVCQTLAKTADGHGRVVATEVLVVTPAVRNLIREGKTHQIYSVMQAGAAHGMHTLDQHLAELVRTRRITYEVGIEKCHHIEDFNRLCGRA